MKKYRYLNTDVFIENKGGRTIRLLQTTNNKKFPLSAFTCDEGKVHSIINCSYFTNEYVLGRNQGDIRNDTHDQEGFIDLVFLNDGSYRVGKMKSWDFCDASKVLGGFSVATILVKDGVDCAEYASAICSASKLSARNPQTAIAILKSGDVLQIVSDGRTDSNKGLTGYELRDFIKSKYDVELLVQCDGGGSTEMIVDGQIVNHPSDGSERAMFNGFAFIGDDTSDDTNEKDDGIMKVLDISEHQKSVDYKAVKDTGIDGAILRCGKTFYGQIVVADDVKFEEHFKGFKAVGMPVGVYYYSSANTVAKAKEEAMFVVNLLKGRKLEYPVWFDVENKQRQENLSKQLLTDIVKAFCGLVESHGYYVGLYASASWLNNKFDMNQLKDYDVWVAHYDVSKPSYNGNYGMWQYTSHGRINGINDDVDLSHCYKDYPSIIKKAKLNGYQDEEVEDKIDELEKENESLEKENESLKNENAEIKSKFNLIKEAILKIKELIEWIIKNI